MESEQWILSPGEIEHLVYLGRWDAENADASLRWPLNGIELNIACTQLSAQIEAIVTEQAPWASVLVDGSMVARFPLAEGRNWYPLLRGMDPSIPHRITICNEIQPMEMSPMKMQLIALQSDGVISPLPKPAYHFEFVGDSLTTGEGCIGPVSAREWKATWKCPALGYAHFTAEEMNAHCSIVSQSGWGVYCDWANERKNNLPRIYDQLCGVIPEGQIPYHFRQEMNAVVINLGTNDVSALKALPAHDQPRRAEDIKQAVCDFLFQIRRHNPKAYLLWVYGMCGQEWMECLQQGVEMARNAGLDRVAFAPLPPCTQEDMGAQLHPGPLNHQKAAKVIVQHLKKVL